MTSFELKVWRRGMAWTQEQAAKQLGVSLRTYQTWESKGGVTRVASLATKGLSVERIWPDCARMLNQLSAIARHG